jgi:hypothetical protein
VDPARDADDGVWTQTKISHWPDPRADVVRLPGIGALPLDLDQNKVRPIVHDFYSDQEHAVDGTTPKGLFGMRRA